MTKRKQIVALLVGVLLLAGAAGTFAWLSVTGVLVNELVLVRWHLRWMRTSMTT